jgi:hypothetical protein
MKSKPLDIAGFLKLVIEALEATWVLTLRFHDALSIDDRDAGEI